MTLPILYSFRRCPYAIRARMALAQADVKVELREVLLKNKPDAMLAASSKGTVPVLVLSDGTVIDESLEIMQWALAQAPHSSWQRMTLRDEQWITANDGDFKYFLDRYKYADRYPERPAAWYRDQLSPQLAALEVQLSQQAYLAGDQPGFVDSALLPFIRQFSMVDPGWFADAPYPSLRRWLLASLASELFLSVMFKTPPWQAGQAPLVVDWGGSSAGP